MPRGGVRIEVAPAAVIRDILRAIPQVQAGLEAVAEDIASDARRLAPVRTGKLRDSIRTERVMRRGQAGDTIRVGAYVFYAQFVELGTRNMSPRPFLRPAAAKYGQKSGKHYAQLARRKARRRR